jgi:hypothetical protein
MGVPVLAAELPRRGLLALADLPAVNDQVVIVGHAVDPDGTEGVAGESHADALCLHRDRMVGTGGRSSSVSDQLPGHDHGVAGRPPRPGGVMTAGADAGSSAGSPSGGPVHPGLRG